MTQETNATQPELKEDGITSKPTQTLVRRMPYSYSDHYTREGLNVSEFEKAAAPSPAYHLFCKHLTGINPRE